MKNLLNKLEQNKDKIFELVAIILIAIFAFSITPKQMQNDIFYTVTIGNYIRENGIDNLDHFSWHEGLPYEYPHWLYDVGMSYIYNLGGFDAIYISTCIFSILLGISIYLVCSRLGKNKLLAFIVTIAVLYLIKGYITARAQLVTFILFIWLVFNIERFIESRKIINAVLLILIHVLIANLHIAVWPFTFVLYLPYIAEYLVSELSDIVLYKKIQILYLKYRTKQINKNIEYSKFKKDKEKYSKKLYLLTEKLINTQDKAERIKIKRLENIGKEYKITIKKNKNVRWLIIIMIIAIFTGLLTPLGKSPFTYTYLTMKGNTVKNINEHLPLTLINNTPMLCTLIILIALITFTRMLIQFFEIFLNKHLDDMIKKCFNKFTAFILIATMLAWSLHLYSKIENTKYVNESTYPVQASEWILENLDVKNIKLFNEYNYGSYLLFKGIPVFIDSRADLYAPEFNTPSGKATDGNDIFMDFINSSNISTYYGDIFEKYNITHVIVYKNSKIAMLIRNADAEKYNEIYSDDNFVIYEVI